MFPPAEAYPMDLVANRGVEVDNLISIVTVGATRSYCYNHCCYHDCIKYSMTSLNGYECSRPCLLIEKHLISTILPEKKTFALHPLHTRKKDKCIANLLQSHRKYVSVCVI